VDRVHEAMRGFPGVVAGIAEALPIFHQAGIYPAVNLGINRNVGGDATRRLHRNDFGSDRAYLDRFYSLYSSAFERFYQRAIDLGFTMANTCYPMSIDLPECEQGLSAVYAATTVAEIVRFSPMEKQVLFRALIAVIRRFRSRIRIFSPLCSLEALIRQYGPEHSERSTYGCRGGVDFFFVNAADGHTYPCGYRGNENLGRLWELDRHRLNPPPRRLPAVRLGMFSRPVGTVRPASRRFFQSAGSASAGGGRTGGPGHVGRGSVLLHGVRLIQRPTATGFQKAESVLIRRRKGGKKPIADPLP
jgi:hypothetical protein